VAQGPICGYREIMQSRQLTSGEIALCRSIFGDAIDYARVRLVKGKWWPFQPRNAAMAPNGNIYFHPAAGGWSEDFAHEPLIRQGFFIHEMTHVWQAQQGGRLYLPLMRHPFCRYVYKVVSGRPFRRYGLEQQAEIVRHLFLHRRGGGSLAAEAAGELERILPWEGTGSAEAVR
jgi:hypothetical protein